MNLPQNISPSRAFFSFQNSKIKIASIVLGCILLVAVIGAILHFTIGSRQPNNPSVNTSYHPYTTGTPNRVDTYTTGTPQANQSGNNNGSDNIAQSLSSCSGNAYLTTAPLTTSSYTSIDPLGHLNPPFHNVPSDHIGFSLITTGSGNNMKSLSATVYSPGDVHILEIENQTVQSSTRMVNDYLLTFAPCKDVVFYLGHVTTLSTALQQEVNNATGMNKSCQTSTQQAATSNVCQYIIDYQAKAGEILGTAGTNVLGMDFGAYDLRTAPLAFIDQTRDIQGPSRYLHTVCPLDYYSNTSVANQLYAKIQNTQKGANGLPSCGSDMQDTPNTLAGNWYIHSYSGSGADNWAEQLSFSHWETNPSIQALVYGGTIVSQGAMITYNPKTNGYVNRLPIEVTNDGHIYCYYQDNFSTDYGQSPQDGGHFIVELLDSKTMKIEFQNGACPANTAFVNPTTYIR